MTALIYRKPFRVRTVDVDLHGRLQPIILLDYVLEAAGDHAGALGLGVTDLFKRGLTWVLSRFHIEILRNPAWGEEAEITTWPSVRGPIFALREFEVAGEDGPVARATSSWLVVDVKTRRPVRSAEILADYPEKPERAIADDFAALPIPVRTEIRREFPVFYSDLDINRHVTATVYVHRALETVPEAVIKGSRPAEIEVNFKAEAFYGDVIASSLERIEGSAGDGSRCFLHRLARAADDRELTLLRTRWEPLSPAHKAD